MNKTKRKTNVWSQSQSMSSTTKHFIQKICYKRTASVDMTQHGFITDTKIHPVYLMLKPLKEKIRKICDQREEKSSAKKLRFKKKSLRQRSKTIATKKTDSSRRSREQSNRR